MCVCVSVRPSSPRPVMVNVLGAFTGEVLKRPLPFYIPYVELLVEGEGQTNGQYHSVVSPPSLKEI